MHCEAKGQILEALPLVIGTLKNGKDWEKREYIMETSTWYHTKMKFSVYSFDGPIIEPPSVGDNIKVLFTVEAKMYKDKWYNEVKAQKIERI